MRPLPDDDAAVPSRRTTWLVVAASAALLWWTASRIEGYRLADSVEYMDRAWDIVRGAGLGPESRRSFTFSFALMPFFAVGRLLGLDSMSGVVVAIRLAQAATALLCVATLLRIATRLGGRAVGIASALFLGLNPIFAQYATEPVSGIAAMLLVTLGFGSLFAPRRPTSDARAGLSAGLWLGLAFVVAYRTLPITGALVLVALLARRRQWLRFFGAWLAGFALCALAGCLVDYAAYGTFGVTMARYVASNVGGVIYSTLWDLGLYDWGKWVYVNVAGHTDISPAHRAGTTVEVVRIQPRAYYFTGLSTRFASLPALLVVALGVVRSFARPHWARSAALLAAAISLGALSMKGSKSFRLLLPLLPLVALLFGSGVGWLADSHARALRVLAWGATLLALALCVPLVGRVNLAQYGAFWRLMERVEELAETDAEPVEVSASHHWAVLFRDGKYSEVTKLPHHLDHWPQLTDAARGEIVDHVSRLDYFIAHLSAVQGARELMEVLGSRFRIAALDWRPRIAGELGPVCLFAADRDGTGPRFFSRRPADLADARAASSESQHPAWVVFEPRDGVRIVFAGWELQAGLAHGEGAWIELHWYVDEHDGGPVAIASRLTDNLAREIWNQDERAHGVLPASSWRAGTLVSERYFVPVPTDVRRFGGPYGRGDRVPLELYVSVTDPERPPSVSIDLEHYAGREPYRAIDATGTRWSRDGTMRMVGGAWLPVPEHHVFPAPGIDP